MAGWGLPFARRRAWRILPPYWAALVFSLAVAWLVVPPPGQGAPDAKSVVVNGLLVQNLVGAPSPNRSFWSIAVEAQLYVLFPLLLLMVRRWGAIVMVATVTLVVAAVGILGPHVSRLDVFVIQSPPDLAALFAVGILTPASWARAGLAGRGRGRGSRSPPQRPCSRRSGGRARCGRSTTCSGSTSRWAQPSVPAGRSGHRPSGPALRLLDARPMRNLGLSSYSLYLTHGPIVVVVYERSWPAGSARVFRPSSSRSPWWCR